MSSKRLSSQKHVSPQTKKAKLSASNKNNYFHVTLRESGLTLKSPPEKCVASDETIHIIRNIKKSLEKHYDYPRNLADLFSHLEEEISDLKVFKHYLFPNIVRLAEDSGEEYQISDSVIKILLSVPILQNKLAECIFEKAIDLAVESNCGPWIQMILKCFSSLDSIVDTEKMSTNLINLLDVAQEKMVKLEIITAIPDIIGDQEHDNIASEMSRILSEDHDLIPAILDCISYLCLTDEQYDQLQKKTLSLLMSLSRCNYFPNFVKFLLLPGRMGDSLYVEAVQGLRNALGWPTTGQQDIATSQVLTAAALRNSMVSSKVISNGWLKVISSCKVHTDSKAIDFVILLILYSTSEEKQKQVENLVRKQIKFDILREELLTETFKKFKPILKEYLKHLIDLTNSILKTTSDPMVETMASHIYELMFSELEECGQTVVAELLQVGLDSKQCVMSILQIFNKVAEKDMSVLKPQSLQMLTLLDRMDDMPLTEIKAVMNLLCGLAYSYENSVIRDDIHMIIRKELASSNPAIKVQGILAAIHAVKYLMRADADEEARELPDNVSYSSVTHLAEGDLREAAQMIELISRSTRQFPDMIAFFYDELSKVISSASVINKNFLSWLTDAVTNDLQQNFIVDTIENDRIGDIKINMQYCLNADSEVDEVIAINIAGLTLQSDVEVCIGILSPLFQLVQILHSKQHEGNLSSIDALLGCPVVMPKFDIDLVEDLDSPVITNILDCLVHCVNWFRELLNAFAPQDDEDLKSKTLQRIIQIEDLESLITEILLKSKILYKPPVSTFNMNKYTGGYVERKAIKVQSNKQKVSKKPAQDDTVLPGTSKSQPTQNNISVKNSLDTSHNLPLRELDLNLLHLINTDMTDDKESITDLTVKSLNFLLKCVNSNIENVLISKIKKKTFLTKQENITYDPAKAEECAKSVNQILPKLMEHLRFVTLQLDKFTDDNQENEGNFLFTSDICSYLTCLDYIYNLCTIYFKWIGFKNQKHGALLKTSLRTVAKPSAATISLKDLLIAVAQFLQRHEKYCLQLSTAVSLIGFLKSIQAYSDNRIILNILINLAESFLRKQWKTPDGILEKGLHFNQSVDLLASIYFINNEVLALKNLTIQLTQEIKLLKTRANTLSNLKCINKSNFTILYRNLGTALYDATKTRLDKGMTNAEHLALWKDVATVLKNMSDIAKTLETRNNLSVFFKKSMPVLKLFQSQGIPILELQLKYDTQEVLEILKILQQSTRFLQTLCCHSRLKKDTVLMSKVPNMRHLLESLIYKVKAALAANKCSEAFWMGNLKNKDIHGEVIASQQSIEDEESADDCDDQLPEDNSDDTDDEMMNPESRSVSDIL